MKGIIVGCAVLLGIVSGPAFGKCQHQAEAVMLDASLELANALCPVNAPTVAHDSLLVLMQKISDESREITEALPIGEIVAAVRARPPAPSMSARQSGFDGPIYFDVGGTQIEVADVEACDAEVGEQLDDATCIDLAMEIKDVYAMVQHELARIGAKQVVDHLAVLETEWDEFFERSRAQTPLELLVNGKRFDVTGTGFNSPPDSQLILLHPVVMLEYVDDLSDGQQQSEGLVLEVVGINYWRKRAWYMPSGASLAVAYSDKADVRDWGPAAVVHFGPASIGIADYSGATGVFLSADLMKLFQSKRKLLEAYGVGP